MRVGLEAWNRPDSGTPDEWARIQALGSACLKARLYHPLEVWDRFAALAPDGLLLLRPDADGDLAPPNLDRFVGHPLALAGRVVYLLDSEPNHVNSPWRERGPTEYAVRLIPLVRSLRDRYPWLRLCSPPLAVVPDEDLRWLAELEPIYQGLGLEFRACHLYWQHDNADSPNWGRRIVRYAGICPGVRWLVDELGDSTPGRPASERADNIGRALAYLARRGDVEAATVFIAGTGDPQWAEFVLPAEELARIKLYLEEQATMTEDNPAILPLLDDIWGTLDKLVAVADQVKADAERIRAQVIAIKEATGLNHPLP